MDEVENEEILKHAESNENYGKPKVKDKKSRFSIGSAAVIGAGFYAGQKEGSGEKLKKSTAFLTKYAPATMSFLGSLIGPAVFDKGLKSFYDMLDKQIKDGEVTVTGSDGIERKLKDLDSEERRESEKEIYKAINDMNDHFRKIIPDNYGKIAVANGVITAAKTAAGYFSGKLFSRIKK